MNKSLIMKQGIRVSFFVFTLVIISLGIGDAQVLSTGSEISNLSGQDGQDMEFQDSSADFITTSQTETEDTRTDHKAAVKEVSGEVKILKNGTSDWVAAENGMTLEVGDQILTGADSYMDLAYDDNYLNIARINANTKAEFRTIEPTDIYLEDGTVFNALDGLSSDDSYQVSTPTAVASVRGTHFHVDYAATSGEIYVATLPVDEDEHESFIAIRDAFAAPDAEPVLIGEGNELKFELGEHLNKNLIQTVNPEMIQKSQQVFQHFVQREPKFQEMRREGLQRMGSPAADRLARGPIKEDQNNRKPGGPGNNNNNNNNHHLGSGNPLNQEGPKGPLSSRDGEFAPNGDRPEPNSDFSSPLSRADGNDFGFPKSGDLRPQQGPTFTPNGFNRPIGKGIMPFPDQQQNTPKHQPLSQPGFRSGMNQPQQGPGSLGGGQKPNGHQMQAHQPQHQQPQPPQNQHRAPQQGPGPNRRN